MLIGALIQKYSKWINNAMVRYSCIIFVTLFIFDVFIDNVFLRLSVCVAFFIFVQNLKVKKVTDAQRHYFKTNEYSRLLCTYDNFFPLGFN